MQILFSVFSFIVTQLISFYSISVNDIEGNQVNFSSFQGKKVLIVNTASASSDAAQYQELQQLYQRHNDSLVIIVFPSNDFGNEPMNNPDSIKNLIRDNYGATYFIGEKSIVSGQQKSYLYNWLALENLNGMMNGVVNHDYFKFLINEEGKLIGVFSSTVNPLDEKIESAINN